MPPFLLAFGALAAGYAAYTAVKKLTLDSFNEAVSANDHEATPARTLRRDPATGIYRPE